MKKTDCPKVVIGVCTYNRCKDLRRLLQSLIKLDYPNFEIIVVDNNSTDQTAQIVSGLTKYDILASGYCCFSNGIRVVACIKSPKCITASIKILLYLGFIINTPVI